jgi:hypothetical protein
MNSKVTFFMPVTERDIFVANYAIRSFSKIKTFPFTLLIYSNYLPRTLKDLYFPKWKRLDFVSIKENNHHDAQIPRPRGSERGQELEGNYDKCGEIWDRELPKITTPYHATIDADFEILNPRFIDIMLSELDFDPHLIAMSVSYHPPQECAWESFSQDWVRMNERWHTCFCIYKKEALQCDVSRYYYEEPMPGDVKRNIWDEFGYYQRALKEFYGYELKALEDEYQGDYIHYGGFSKNVAINRQNVWMYRWLMVTNKRLLRFKVKTYYRWAAHLLKRNIPWLRDRRDRFVEKNA